MMSEVVNALIPLAFFGSVLLAIYFFLRFRNSERLALIEKAADPAMFKMPSGFRFPWFKIGVLFTGLGIGILVGTFFQSLPVFEATGTGIVFSMFVFGGLAMILADKFDKSKSQEAK